MFQFLSFNIPLFRQVSFRVSSWDRVTLGLGWGERNRVVCVREYRHVGIEVKPVFCVFTMALLSDYDYLVVTLCTHVHLHLAYSSKMVSFVFAHRNVMKVK